MLSAKLLLNQGIDLIGLHFVLPFTAPDADLTQTDPARRARDIGLNLRFIRCESEYIAMASNPPHGFGSRMNPCIDCKIFFMRYAARVMSDEGASFVSTGEVIGQRPMSQMKWTMRHILKEADLDGRLLRPLSALKLPPTIAEEEGIVDRSQLLDLSGRGRSRQMEIARSFGIEDYASPAGGCLFTDPNVARRIKDLYANRKSFDAVDLYLLSFGRHFRLNEKCSFIVARNEDEWAELEKYRSRADLFLEPQFPGPAVFVQGEFEPDKIPFFVSIAARYGKPDKEGSRTVIAYRGGTECGSFSVEDIADDSILDTMRI